jgi:hypothetical protein
MPKRSRKKSEDLNQTAHRVVAEATGEIERPKRKNPAAVALGRLGGAKGGKARAEKLSPARRKEIAAKAALARWGTPKEK